MTRRPPATLDGVRAKIARAEEHYQQLLAVWRSAGGANRYDYEVRDDVARNVREMVVARADPPPPVLPLILGDAVHNLRAALDLLMRQLLIANGVQPKDGPGGTQFPRL